MIVFDIPFDGSMRRVAAVGSCRITAPIEHLCDTGAVDRVWYDSIMTHTTADARQNLDMVRTGIEPPAFFEPLIHQPGGNIRPPPHGAEIMESIDTFLVEVCENTLLQVGPWSVLVTRLGDTILSEYAEALLAWWNDVCVLGRATDETVEQAIAEFRGKPIPDELAPLLRNMTRTTQDEHALCGAMTDLMQAYPGRWIFVSHFAVPGVKGTLMTQRRGLAQQLRQAATLVGAEFFDPSVLLAQVGRERALAADGADVYHYSVEFERLLGEEFLGLLQNGAKVRRAKPLARVHERLVDLVRRSDVIEGRFTSDLSSFRRTLDADRQDLVEVGWAAQRLETQMVEMKRLWTLLQEDLVARYSQLGESQQELVEQGWAALRLETQMVEMKRLWTLLHGDLLTRFGQMGDRQQELVEQGWATQRVETQMADVRRLMTLLHEDLATRDARIDAMIEESAAGGKRELVARSAFEAELVRTEELHAQALSAAEAERVRTEKLHGSAAEAERVRTEELHAQALSAAEAERVRAEKLHAQALSAAEAEGARTAKLHAQALSAAEAERVSAEKLHAQALSAVEAKQARAEKLHAQALSAAEAKRAQTEKLHAQALSAAEAKLEKARADAERQQKTLQADFAANLAELTDRMEAMQSAATAAQAAARREYDQWIAARAVERTAELERVQSRFDRTLSGQQLEHAEALATRDARIEALGREAATAARQEQAARAAFEADRARMEAAHAEALSAVQTRLEAVRSDAETRERELRAEFTASLAGLGERLDAVQSAAAAGQAALKQEYEARIATLAAERTAAETALKQDHEARFAALAHERAAAEEALRRDHQAALATLAGEQAAELERMQAALDHALTEREVILRSTAWRATAPLRGGLTVLRGRPRPNGD